MMGCCLQICAAPAHAVDAGESVGVGVGVAAAGASSAASAAAELTTVVVTSRNREESAQDVPIPISVLSESELDRDGTVAIQDLTRKAPGLEATTPNSRRTGISVRGIGKSAGNDALEASMGVIVDGVFLTHPGMTYQDFTDLDRIEVLRGPQGTLLGKNTTIGAINFVSKAPSFAPQGTATFTVGERDMRSSNASYSNSIVDGLLAYRASAFVDKQDGYITNVNTEGGTTNEKNRSGGRLQFLLTPGGGFTARVNADFAETDERSNTKPIVAVLSNYDDAAHTSRITTPGGTGVPADAAGAKLQNTGTNTYTSIFNRAYFGGYQPIVGSVSAEDLNLNVPVLTRNQGISSDLNWDLGSVTLTLISATRSYTFDAKNDADQTKFDTGRSGTAIAAGQQSHELRINQVVSERLDYQAGLYFLHSWNTSDSRTLYGLDSGAYSSKNGDYNVLYGSAAGGQLLQAALNRVYLQNIITPDTRSYAAFGQANWHFSDRATVTLGLRETYEDKTSSSTKLATFIDGTPLDNLTTLGQSIGASALQISSANNIRATTVGTTYSTVQGTPIKAYAPSWLVSPNYKLSDAVLLYGSAGSGRKSGSVQFDSTGKPLNVAPEKVLDFELGLKSLLLRKRLLLNVNLYQTTVRDYQQTTSVFDAATTAIKNDGNLFYTSVLGNIPRIRARGIELEGAFNVTRDLSFTFGATYNDAIYASWHTATCPNELNAKSSTTVCDNTGKQIVAAPKYTTTIGADYQRLLFAGLTGHLWVNNVYRTKQNFDNNLSRYGIQGAYAVTDLGVGIRSPNGKFEVDFVAKNAFDKRYTTSVNVGTDGSIGYDGIGEPRWVGVVFHAKL